MIRLCFLIRQLDQGGTQRQLVELVKGLDKSKYEVELISFYPGGPFSAELTRLGRVACVSLEKRGRWDLVRFGYRLVREIRHLRPHLLHGYLSSANLLCVALKPFLAETRIVWGVRSSTLACDHEDWLARLMFWLQRPVARFADLIIANSYSGREYCIACGLPPDKIIVIPNGVDTETFYPDADGRKRVRGDWSINEEEKLIGLVGRLDPLKDHPTFLRAAGLLARSRDDVRFVCVGNGPAGYRDELRKLGQRLGVNDRIIWEGSREDMPSVYSALDIATSCSYSESFPNVIGEAMACGAPCVVTDVGDSATIVGDTGVVVRPRDPEALAEGWRSMLGRLATEGSGLGEKARLRVVLEFGRDKLVRKTSEALEALL